MYYFLAFCLGGLTALSFVCFRVHFLKSCGYTYDEIHHGGSFCPPVTGAK